MSRTNSIPVLLSPRFWVAVTTGLVLTAAAVHELVNRAGAAKRETGARLLVAERRERDRAAGLAVEQRAHDEHRATTSELIADVRRSLGGVLYTDAARALLREPGITAGHVVLLPVYVNYQNVLCSPIQWPSGPLLVLAAGERLDLSATYTDDGVDHDDRYLVTAENGSGLLTGVGGSLEAPAHEFRSRAASRRVLKAIVEDYATDVASLNERARALLAVNCECSAPASVAVIAEMLAACGGWPAPHQPA
jgi:hypothetical protein